MKMRGGWIFPVLILVVLGLGAPPTQAKPATGEKADVRILIDISGSMKKNDPENLRRPALRLLVGLLPTETRAGVWTFGQYVNMQIPLGQVDAAWKRKARNESKKIGSPGQRTNIEMALKRASEDWEGSPTLYRRSLILLTDGMVDVSRNKAKNKASRKQILNKILPRLKKMGVAVNTIALSENADHELMRKLAEATGGWYEQVNDANQLQRVFLRIFEKVGKPDAVPLKDNQFTIDDSITEATVLVFHKPGAKPTQLIPPGGKPIDAESAPDSISWHRDEGYDMLTISDPKSGEWRIRAEVDPDNRVMVVTDLKMNTTDLPSRLIHGQSLPFLTSFTDHGKRIRKKSFLNVVEATAQQRDGNGESEPRPLLDDGKGPDPKAGDGFFSMRFGGESLSSGNGELIISAKGRTFVREKRMSYEVVPPVMLEVKPGEIPNQLLLTLMPAADLVDPASVKSQVWLETAEGEQTPLDLIQDAGGVSQGNLDITTFSGARKIVVSVDAKTVAGESVEYFDAPVEVEGIMPPPAAVEPKPEPVTEPTPTPAAESPAEAVEEKRAEKPEPAVEEEEESLLMTAVWLGGGNLLLLLALGGGFWWMRRRNQQGLVSLLDEELPENLPAAEVKEAA
ncbi:MAG: hypothetical protein OI74_04615 [Gammaproteobacteria bacterium (ex Lamellibrachia satsuma)]|nr:MAG: VWA domain-containing protein [Gammaproteobacteria bacterium (ex Lamellibrachia satsuma)]RRS34692.1 MAG: hypothetical protein OI74_04615 [Gammaproteobacteria bacterium (ex Lamellibrachia satsuma)]RRS35271.1 MAG: hypothetical protein NV67_10955 [Gammaproteobacteria bacterium (ex Lamellibrachia satsuma)]